MSEKSGSKKTRRVFFRDCLSRTISVRNLVTQPAKTSYTGPEFIGETRQVEHVRNCWCEHVEEVPEAGIGDEFFYSPLARYAPSEDGHKPRCGTFDDGTSRHNHAFVVTGNVRFKSSCKTLPMAPPQDCRVPMSQARQCQLARPVVE